MYAAPAKVLIATRQQQYIISSDNGLLPLVLNDTTQNIYSWPEVPGTYKEWTAFVVDLAEQLCHRDFRLDTLPVHHPQAFSIPPRPVFKDNAIECHIVHVDQYGNVILNLTKEDFETQQQGRKFRIMFRHNEYIDTISSSYTEVPPKEKLCLFNNAGYLEIAINKDSAARLLGLSLFNTSSLVYQTIRIEFI
jgi:S-adenosylmethionine hydrolase